MTSLMTSVLYDIIILMATLLYDIIILLAKTSHDILTVTTKSLFFGKSLEPNLLCTCCFFNCIKTTCTTL